MSRRDEKYLMKLKNCKNVIETMAKNLKSNRKNGKKFKK
jgi:hypothetical protein